MTAACGGTGSSGSSGETLTVYSADGLATWYKSQFDKFTKDTGIAVNLVEAGSGEVVSRVEKEQSNPQADLLVTLPPFIQKADKSGLLVASGVDTKGIPADQVGPDGNYVPIVNNALSFIANPSANPQPETWDDLLAPQYKGKLQYSTPGQAGDGTAVLILLQHLRGKPGRTRLPDQAAGQQRRPVVVHRQAAAQGEQRRVARRQRRCADEPGLDQGRRLEVQHLHPRRP